MCPMSSKPPEQSGKAAGNSYLKNSYFGAHIQPLIKAEGRTLFSAFAADIKRLVVRDKNRTTPDRYLQARRFISSVTVI